MIEIPSVKVEKQRRRSVGHAKTVLKTVEQSRLCAKTLLIGVIGVLVRVIVIFLIPFVYREGRNLGQQQEKKEDVLRLFLLLLLFLMHRKDLVIIIVH